MIKLGIFGDSFADPQGGHPSRPDMDTLAWPHLFPRDLYQVTTHGAAGSSVYYSWSQFNQHQHQYDRVVFVATTFGRFPGWFPPINKYRRPKHVGNWFQVQKNRRDDPEYRSNVEYKQFLNAVESFYLELTDSRLGNWIQDFCNLMLADVIRQRPDVLLIPNLPLGLAVPEGYADNQSNLCDYFPVIARSLRPEIEQTVANKNWIEYEELRCCCHLTPEANQHLAGQVQAHIESGARVWKPQLPLTIPHQYPFDYYYGNPVDYKNPTRNPND